MFRYALILTVLSLFSGFAIPGGAAQEVFFFPQIADGTAGGLTLQTEFIFVNTGADTTVTLEFFDGSGNPLSLELGSLGRGSMFDIGLRKGQSTSEKTPGTGDPQGTIAVGYARVTAGSGVGATAVFTTVDATSGIVQSEAGVPATTPLSTFTVFVDSLGNVDTGLAILKPPVSNELALTTVGDSGDLTLTLYDTSFNPISAAVGSSPFGPVAPPIATTNIPLGAGQQLPQFVSQFFAGNAEVVAQAQEMQGTLTVKVGGGQSVAAVTLRQNVAQQPGEVTTLTTFPVVPGAADADELIASLSVVGEGQILVDVEPPADETVVGAIYRVYSGNTKLGEFVRSVEGAGPINEVLALAESGDGVSHVEVRLILSSGETSPVITATP